MNKGSKWLKQFIVAALCSAVASLMIVAVGPGFSKPDNASDKAADKGASASGEEHSNSGGNSAASNGAGSKAAESKGTGGGSSSDHDGDHDSNPGTPLEDDHDTADAGDNAHPSGKDRSVEHGKSGNQGKAESNPDDSKGPQRFEGGRGDDKPQGPGGLDRADQDGNNGCGNDDDFDDDNNGHCGKPSTPTNPTEDCTGDTNPHNNKSCDEGGEKPKKITICHATGSESNPFVVITVSENAWPAHQAHGDTMLKDGSCVKGTDTTKLCPADTDYAGLPMPDGTEESCDDDDSTPPGGRKCPNDTDMAGLPIPAGGIAACDTDVLGDIIDKGDDDPNNDVMGASERRGGRALPFTGASIIAYVLVGLQLIGAGVLIARARKKS